MKGLFSNIRSREGFTLIEILVVTTVIAVITALIVVTFSETRMKSRDAARKADFQQMKTVIELYINDNGGFPPLSLGCAGGVCTSNLGANWIPGLVPTYISGVPVDPVNTSSFRYRYSQLNDTYELDTVLEHFSNDKDEQKDGGDCSTRYEVGSVPGLTLLSCSN